MCVCFVLSCTSCVRASASVKAMAVEQHRLFIGGLFKGISKSELEQRFSRYGEVQSVDIISRFDENGEVYKTFGYIDLKADDNNVKKCLQTYNGSKWKGHSLTIQTAKESFLQRLKREREEEKSKEIAKKAKKTLSAKERLQESFSKAGVKDFNIRNAVPGSEIPGEKNWTVTRFGRVVPIIYIRSKNKRKVNKIDPSKHSHAFRRFKDEKDITFNVDKLTWELDAVEDNVQYQKRIGAYSIPTTKKKRKLSHHVDSNLSENSDSEVLTHQSAGNMFSYQYEGDKMKVDDFEIVSEKYGKFSHQEADTKTQHVVLHYRVYESSSEDESVSHENVLILPKAKNNSYISLTSKSTDGEKGQNEEIDVPNILPETQQKTYNKELIERTSDILESVSTKTKLNQSNYDSDNQNIKRISTDTVDVSSSKSNSNDDDKSEKDLEEADNQITVKELDSLRNKSVPEKVYEQDSGYLIFGTKDPVDTEEDVLDMVNTDSSRMFYYQSAINPITNENIEFMVLEPQGKETKELHVLQEDSEEKDKSKEEREENEYKVNESKREDEEREGNQSKAMIDFIVLQSEKCLEKMSVETKARKDYVLDVEGQIEYDDTDSVSSANTDDVCSGKCIMKLAGKKSKREPDALGVVEFGDEIAPSAVENDRDSHLKNQTLQGSDNSSVYGDEDQEPNEAVEGNSSDDDVEASSDNGKNIGNKDNENEDASTGEDVNNDDGISDEDGSGSTDGSSDEDGRSDENGHSVKDSSSDEDASTGEDVNNDDGISDEDGSGSTDGSSDEDGRSDENGHSVKDSSSDEDDSSDEDENSSDEEDITDEMTQNLMSPSSLDGRAVSGSSSKNLDIKEHKKVLDRRVLAVSPAKQASSNIKRLESVQKRKEVVLGQKKAIQMALAAVDSKTGPAQGKHIIFDSDDEEEHDGMNILFQDKADPSKLTNKGPILFASDEDSSNDEDDNARFQIKPQFEGKSGERLRKLQEQIGGDDRFTMDKSFLEDQSDEDDDDPSHLIPNSFADESDEDVDNEVDLKTEKEKSLSILQSIVGTKGIISRPKEKIGQKLGFRGMMIRYDPSRDDHTQYEVQSKEKRPSSLEGKSAKKSNEAPEIIVPEVSKEKYFEVSGDITNAFGNDKRKIDT
ncbi:nucleolar protein 8-like, partial [Anneissia japonica]|uniref:nucleolar protein 8-like n=1 Tax=Anneissia japonica TaxID=1529436 RepID=UPI0014259E6C